MITRVAGADGAPGGWVVALLEMQPTSSKRGQCTLQFVDSIDSMIERLGVDLDILTIDMPIGLSEDGNRPVDAEVRAYLGPRRSTFFPTPIRDVLDQENWEAANAASRAASGKGLSMQSWNLVPKIREVDRAWRPDVASQLVEAHPECTFAAMAGAPLISKKQSPEGRSERQSLLDENLRVSTKELLVEMPGRLHIDAIDALALAWTARRVGTGEACHLGCELDALGRPMQLFI